MKHYKSNDEQPGSLGQRMPSYPKPPYDLERLDSSSAAIASVLDRLGLGQVDRSPDRDVDQLATNLHHPEWAVRAAAAHQLGTLPQQSTSLALLLHALQDENGYVRAAAARSLGRQGARAAVQPLLRALNDTEWTARAAAVQALGHLAADVSPEPLIAALDDTDASVRAAAAWSLGKFGKRAPIRRLVAALEDPEWSVREAAMLAIRELQKWVPASVLEAAQADADYSVREAAQRASRRASDRQFRLFGSDLFNLQGMLQKNLVNFRNYTKHWGTPGNEQDDEPVVILSSDDQPPPDQMRDNTQERRAGANPGLVRRSRLLYFVESSVAVLVLLSIVFFWMTFPNWSLLHLSGAQRPSPLLIHNSYAGSDYQIAWAPDGSRLAISSEDGSVGIWDADTGHLISTYQNYLSRVFALLWTSNDYLLVASQSADRVVQVWSAPNEGILFTTPPLSGEISAVSWSPNGEDIAFSSGDNKVQVWNISSGQLVSSYTGHKGGIIALAWSPDSQQIASISYDQTLQIWQAATGTRTMPSLVSGTALTFIIWSPSQRSSEAGADGRIAYATFSGAVEIWDATSWHKTLTISPIGRVATTPSPLFVTTLAWSPDGSALALATANGSIQTYDATTGDLINSYQNQSNEIGDLAWSPDGTHIASTSPDGTVQIEKISSDIKSSLMWPGTRPPDTPSL